MKLTNINFIATYILTKETPPTAREIREAVLTWRRGYTKDQAKAAVDRGTYAWYTNGHQGWRGWGSPACIAKYGYWEPIPGTSPRQFRLTDKGLYKATCPHEMIQDFV